MTQKHEHVWDLVDHRQGTLTLWHLYLCTGCGALQWRPMT